MDKSNSIWYVWIDLNKTFKRNVEFKTTDKYLSPLAVSNPNKPSHFVLETTELMCYFQIRFLERYIGLYLGTYVLISRICEQIVYGGFGEFHLSR